MSEFEAEIPIPMSERVKISDLKFDQDNPNRMSLALLDRLKVSIKKWRRQLGDELGAEWALVKNLRSSYSLSICSCFFSSISRASANPTSPQ